MNWQGSVQTVCRSTVCLRKGSEGWLANGRGYLCNIQNVHVNTQYGMCVGSCQWRAKVQSAYQYHHDVPHVSHSIL
jgi:NADH:ubiquinone oxidoreductase subunit E